MTSTPTDATTRAGTLTTVEQRGIEPVPAAERTGTPGALFWVWFAANISILGLPPPRCHARRLPGTDRLAGAPRRGDRRRRLVRRGRGHLDRRTPRGERRA
ncbi:hypothetical protein [Curtobacterium sp. MCJR17_043]|uniref:hypothetical protein n=1 Tax=Curtobacterium sp. MCJR17_043 TaxID=2175660 RepID=UPI0024DFD7BC|nr:hypothetical protein [Curtobacterium sp. MCJR17_043]WIB36019.1 hypothetical protein DEJ15_01655 [Curtobacterium sp. MCJR17_043]